MDPNSAFQWKCEPEAENFILSALANSIQSNLSIAKLEEDLFSFTSTRLFDWLDYVVIAETDHHIKDLLKFGFVQQGNGFHHIYVHPKAQLPRVVLIPPQQKLTGIAVCVDSIADYLMVRGLNRTIEGPFFGNFRRCQISVENEVALWVVERRGTLNIQPSHENTSCLSHYLSALESWMTRPRSFPDEEWVMHETLQLIQKLIEEVGQQRAAWTVLEGERRYWQSRNSAAQIQKNRQDRLGMGWANHDHHTFRSSRRYFNQLVHLFELLGFHCRERFYAGAEAGWGAQVMENPIGRLVLFLDVDLAPDEIRGDFAHEPLPDLPQLGTVGLWCALHGDSILKGGMHHLEAQFMFEDLSHELANRGVKMMNPFSSFSYLKQAFTEGENWAVDPLRVKFLVECGKITSEQGEKFILNGAIGSHLENLQRREGYKGFNQKNVSLIIKDTDPRIQFVDDK